MMTYERVEWAAHDPELPVEVYSELDEDRWEVRKVEVFADGRLRFADGVDSTGRTGLSEVPMPTVDQTNTQDGLTATVIDGPTFEALWSRATGRAPDDADNRGR